MLDLVNSTPRPRAAGRLGNWGGIKLSRERRARYLTGQACECESACRDNLVEQRKHGRMASGVVNVHDYDGMANRGENFVPKFVSDIEVMGELVSRREYSAQRAPLNRSRSCWRQYHPCP